MNTAVDVMTEQLPRRHLITVEEYHRMDELGLLAPDARVELIEGEFIDMPPIGRDHAAIVDELNFVFVQAIGRRAIVRIQGPVQLSNISEPQPDLMLLRPRADRYREEQAGGTDTLLVVEVSASSFRYDRTTKLALYARHKVPEVWIVEVEGNRLHCFRALQGMQYTDVSSALEPKVMPVPGLEGVSVDLSCLFS